MEVALSYYEQYVQNPIESPISIEAIKLLNARFLLVKIKNKLIYNSFEENNYLYNIFKKRLDWALNEAYHKFREFFSSDERLCFMVEFIKILDKCREVSIVVKQMSYSYFSPLASAKGYSAVVSESVRSSPDRIDVLSITPRRLLHSLRNQIAICLAICT